ncbi:hypothetical protein RCL_jg22814.t1 [Rhizophagus clarus]|uniref:Uncharacterized protein n=1 Tax=Rhizophagus clarus TaxID=94130 RepID=A0A8H3LF12_9GLOM|nr:hypothetical protein RCL_jg22814.t1 [Rhizophagus clarus]
MKIYRLNYLYGLTLYGARIWAEEKREQLAYRLNWLSIEPVKKLLQQEGYELLSSVFEWPIMDMLGPRDIESIKSHSQLTSDWWYKPKVWLEDSQNKIMGIYGANQ